MLEFYLVCLAADAVILAGGVLVGAVVCYKAKHSKK